MITSQLNGSYYRTVPLHKSEEHQNYVILERSEVPPLADDAVVGEVTPRSVRYDSGVRSWYVAHGDKACIRAYCVRRDDDEVEAGAFPIFACYRDDGGPL